MSKKELYEIIEWVEDEIEPIYKNRIALTSLFALHACKEGHGWKKVYRWLEVWLTEGRLEFDFIKGFSFLEIKHAVLCAYKDYYATLALAVEQHIQDEQK